MNQLLVRHFSNIPAGFRRLSLGSSDAKLAALIPTATDWEKPKLLCLPSAFGSAAHDFSQQFSSAQLSRNFELYSLDFPTRHFSYKHIKQDAEDVIRAADALELSSFSLLGYRHGANVSAVVAATYPERVTRLVLVNGNAFVSDEDIENYRALANVKTWPKDAREAAEAKYGMENVQNKWNELVAALGQVERENGGDLICGYLPNVKCKTLVVAGEQSKMVPSFHGEYLSERIIHSRLEIVAEGEQEVMLSAAERFNALLASFLLEPDDKLTQSREFVAVPIAS